MLKLYIVFKKHAHLRYICFTLIVFKRVPGIRNAPNYRKTRILTRHAFTNVLDVLGNAGMHNQSELAMVTFAQIGKRKQRPPRMIIKTAISFILKSLNNDMDPFIINFKRKISN